MDINKMEINKRKIYRSGVLPKRSILLDFDLKKAAEEIKQDLQEIMELERLNRGLLSKPVNKKPTEPAATTAVVAEKENTEEEIGYDYSSSTPSI